MIPSAPHMVTATQRHGPLYLYKRAVINRFRHGPDFAHSQPYRDDSPRSQIPAARVRRNLTPPFALNTPAQSSLRVVRVTSVSGPLASLPWHQDRGSEGSERAAIAKNIPCSDCGSYLFMNITYHVDPNLKSHAFLKFHRGAGRSVVYASQRLIYRSTMMLMVGFHGAISRGPFHFHPFCPSLLRHEAYNRE